MSSNYAKRVQKKRLSSPQKVEITECINMKIVVKNSKAGAVNETKPIETGIDNPRAICEYVHLTKKEELHIPIFDREGMKVNQEEEVSDRRSRSKSTSVDSDSSDRSDVRGRSQERYTRHRRNSRESSKDRSRRSKDRARRSSSKYRSRSRERDRRSREKSSRRTRDRSGSRHRYRKSSRSRSRHRRSPSYRRSRDRKSRSRERKSRSRDRKSRSRRSRSRSGGSYNKSRRRRSSSRQRKRSITPLRPGEYRPGHPDLALREKRSQNTGVKPATETKPTPEAGFPMGPMPINYGYFGDPYMMGGFPPRIPMMPPAVYANYYRQHMMRSPMMPRMPVYNTPRPRFPSFGNAPPQAAPVVTLSKNEQRLEKVDSQETVTSSNKREKTSSTITNDD